MTIGADMGTALPEIIMAVLAMILLLVGAYQRSESGRFIAWLSIITMVVAGFLVLIGSDARVAAFNGLFVVDGFTDFAKVLILLGAALALLLSFAYNVNERIDRFEYPVLILFAVLGMMMMVSSNDLIALYLGIELQSLALYVIAAFRRDTVRSSEAGLKYFVLGALSSGILLYGMSLVYGFAGTTNFDMLSDVLAAQAGEGPSVGLIVGIVFIAAGLAFKVSAVPFHMWTPDVYEGAPTPVTAFFAVAPKIAAMVLFVRVMFGPFGELLDQWQQIIVFISLASMILGAFAAINQNNIKRLMAYSSIGNMGYALVGLAAGTDFGAQSVLLYLTIYLFMNTGAFACILAMRRDGRMVEGIDELAGLSKTNPRMALALGIFMFSMAGIPPLAGFFGKLYVFWAAVEAGLPVLAVIGLLTSVVAAFYYLRIVKLMYFDEPADRFDRPVGGEISAILVGTSVVTLFFFVGLAPVLNGAERAAAFLFAV